MGGFHTVTLPDGRSVDFPASMSDGDINAAVGKIVGGAKTVGAPTQPQQQSQPSNFEMNLMRGMGLDPEKINRIQTTPEGGISPKRGWLEAGKEALQGTGKWLDATLKDPAHIADPINALASGITTGLGLPDKSNQPILSKSSYTAPNPGLLTGSLAMTALGVDKGQTESFAKNVSESGRLLKQADAINQAQVQVVNNHVRGPLARLDAAVNGEIGQHVKAAVDADRAQMQASGAQVGMVSGAKALDAAHAKLGSMGGMAVPTSISGLFTEAARPMSLNEAKSLTTDVGRTAAALTRQGNLRQAAVLNELYNGLHEATQARADELGAGKSWKQYIDLTRSYKNLQEGLAGELVDEPVHAKVMEKLIDPKRGTEWNELRDELAKRDIDTTQFEKARDYAKQMSDLVQTTSNLFVGKLRAIIRHPFTAGPAAITAGKVGSLTGIPGLSFVLPMIAAGKVSGLLDSAAAMKLVKEIAANVAPEASRAGEALPPPMKPQADAGSLPPEQQYYGGFQPGIKTGEIATRWGVAEDMAPTKSLADRIREANKPKGGINPKGYEQSMKPVDLADQISAIQTNTRDLKEQMRVASSMFSDEEIQQAEQRMAENDKLVKELQATLKARKKK